jgi:hypothetical protein
VATIERKDASDQPVDMKPSAPGAMASAWADPARFGLLLALLTLLLTAPRLLLHELWRDEAWLWIVATGSRSLADLQHDLSRSGQGYLFPLLCWMVARVWSSPYALQLLNLVIVVAAAYVVGRWAPLRRAECTLLVLGYYACYEYAVLSRHYGLGMLLVFAACAALRQRRSPVVLGLLLGLLCQTTVYGFMLALTIGLGAVILHVQWRRRGNALPSAGSIALATLLAAGGALAGLVQLIPESGTPFAAGWFLRWEWPRLLETLQVPWRGLLPVLRLQVEAWNSDVLSDHAGWRALGGVLALSIAGLILGSRKLALALFAIGVGGVLAFTYFKFIGSMRHHGHVWLLLVAVIWMVGGIGSGAARRRWREWVFVGLLAIHVLAAAVASYQDLRHPFSNGARAAQLIRAKGFDRLPLLGYREPPASPIALALRQPLYAPSRSRYATHTDWGPLQRDVSMEELRCAARALAAREGRDIVLVMTTRLPDWPELRFQGAVEGAIVPNENYFLYRLAAADLSAAQHAAVDAACAGAP